MKKLVAVLFLSLICLATISGGTKLWGIGGYELITDCDEAETENKEAKKELKEFTVTTHKKTYAAPSLIYRHKVHQAFIFPQPVLNKQSPPPDYTC